MPWTRRLGSALLLAALAAPAPCADSLTPEARGTEAPFTDGTTEARYRALIGELRCLVCQNESIADSHAPLAADLRREVRAMLEAGRSEAEVREFLVRRYGDFVLYRPPFTTTTAALWLLPALLLLAGGVALLRGVRARRVEVAPALDADMQRRVSEALEPGGDRT